MNDRKLLREIDFTAFKNAAHAAARIRKDAQESLIKAEGASKPGTPPHTHKRQFLKNAITFDVSESGEAVVGPRFSRVGESGEAHEFGGEYKGAEYPERKFMLPAMERNVARFAGEWAGSIGE